MTGDDRRRSPFLNSLAPRWRYAAIGSFVVKDVNLVASAIAAVASFALIAIAYYITPQDKEK